MESHPAAPQPQPEANPNPELKTVYISLADAAASQANAAAHPAPESSDPAELAQIQALELAANRAELNRQQREIEELRRAVRLRDTLLDELRNDLKETQSERHAAATQLAEARALIEQMKKKGEQQAALIGQLEAQIAERFSMTAVASESLRPRPAKPSTGVAKRERPPQLQPIDDDSESIVLNRKVMTVGRTRENDICVPSALVSRDHARILVSDEEVELIDVGSINGSFVNNSQVRRHALRDGDVIRFADRHYRYCE
jgi:hypothetical protein